jgi:hypothetical protein
VQTPHLISLPPSSGTVNLPALAETYCVYEPLTCRSHYLLFLAPSLGRYRCAQGAACLDYWSTRLSTCWLYQRLALALSGGRYFAWDGHPMQNDRIHRGPPTLNVLSFVLARGRSATTACDCVPICVGKNVWCGYIWIPYSILQGSIDKCVALERETDDLNRLFVEWLGSSGWFLCLTCPI